MKKKIIISVVVGLIIISAVYVLYDSGYLQKLLHIQAEWQGDYPYDKYICFVYKIEPKYGEGVGGVPNELTAYIWTNSPPNRTNVQFEWEDDNNKYLSAHLWLDEYNGYVEKLDQYSYKVSYPISGYSYNYKSGYRWSLYVWLYDEPHGHGGSAIWEINELHWIWYKDNRNPQDYTPLANTGGPYIAQVGERIKLDATKSVTPIGSNLIEWYWDIDNDGIWDKYGKEKYITFQNAGVYTIKLLVINDKSYYDTDTTTVTVTNVNNPPVADADGRYSGVIGENIRLDGSKSYDPDGNPLSYEWDVDGDGTYDLTGKIVNVTYYKTGTFNVVLKVSDGQYSDTDTTTVTISSPPPPPPTNEPPVAEAGGPYECYVGEEITLDGSESHDPDGYIVDYKWDIDNDGVWDLHGKRASVVFHNTGSFIVKLNVTDNDSATAEDTALVTVKESQAPPTTPPEREKDYWIYGLLALLILIPIGLITWKNKNEKKGY